MRLFINSLAASAGGGLTYIRNVIPHLADIPDLQIAVLGSSSIGKEFSASAGIEFLELECSAGRRFWYEQFKLPALLRAWDAEVLLSTGNFALRNSPVPQILLSRNSIYTSADFYRDLRSRHEYRMWLETRIRGALARQSIAWANLTVAPTESFANDLRRWSGSNHIVALHHGFDLGAFTRDHSPLPPELEKNLPVADSSLRLLFVSHYNYYRNFETLIQALPAIRASLAGRNVKLLLTCKLAAGENPGAYRPDRAAQLVRDLGVSEMVIELGAVAYRQLHHVYRGADIYVTPAYTETFAHPLLEAMACGLPIVASDLPVHREICGSAAHYFSRFSHAELAARVLELASSEELRATLRANASKRSEAFSWRRHAQELFALACALTTKDTKTAGARIKIVQERKT
jgi:glycosyltransferase involved in cell wall biosynthesis